MRLMKVGLLLVAALTIAMGIASAQTTTGVIRGHVADQQNLALPGVTITITSPSLQGERTTVTTESGDFILPGLPAGTYKVTAQLSGFETLNKTVDLAPTQDLPVAIELGPARVSEEVTVVGRSSEVLAASTQVTTDLKNELVRNLATTGNIDAYILMAPAVHPTGPSGAYSINGSTSFENLFMVNGVTVNENLRGQANDLYIEDAIQETTVSTAGISAEYGRFSGGVVNVVTKSGGNIFSGSFRDTLVNDKWRKLTPYEDTAIAGGAADSRKLCDTAASCVVPTYEYTLGGPIMKDRLWFFTAGRLQTQTSGMQLVGTNISYQFSRPSKRYEGKGTYTLNANHRFSGAYTKIFDDQVNNTFNTAASMDLASLETRKTPQDLWVVNYNGILKHNLFVEALASKRHFSFIGSGAKTTDIIGGTLMVDSLGRRYWSATFCGVCDPEHRDNADIYGKATYFLSTSGMGSHTITAGGDSYNDIRFANNHQSGSDYRIISTQPAIIRGSGDTAVVYPNIPSGTSSTVGPYIQWNPIPISSQGSNFRTYSGFLNDNWRYNDHWSFNLGLRYDKNHGENQQAVIVARDSALSPRLGAMYDLKGDGSWTASGSFAQYTAALSNSIADSSSAGGNPQQFRFVYQGPAINPDPTATNLVPTDVALQQIFAWFNANGGPNLPFRDNPSVPGVSPVIGGNLKSPNTLEYATGLAHQFTNRAAARVDFIHRKYRDFYVERRDTTTGQASTTVFGRTFSFDKGQIENSNVLHRSYDGLSGQATYRLGARTDFGGTYTLSFTKGNFNAENTGSGPITSDALIYPEYRQASWNYPDGYLQNDQRHRARLWLNYGVPKVTGLSVSFMEILESGTPFGPNNLNAASANGVDPRPYVTNPGYLSPPTGGIINYYYTADCSNVPAVIAQNDITCVGGQRDAFRLQGQVRTDFAANYTHSVMAGKQKLDLFFQAQIVNLFNQFQFCGCGGTVFVNGGNVQQTRIDQTVRTAVSNPATYSTFNPFTQTPVQGVNWDYAPTFGTALNRFAYTTPIQFRTSFGVRF